jgi:hypothetical protein
MTLIQLKIAYVSLTALMVAILIMIGVKVINRSFTNKEVTTKKKGILIAGLLLWQAYVVALASSGLLDDFSFPPRFFIFLILPLFVFTGFFIYKNRNSKWISAIPVHWLVFYQSFRILIESIFVLSVAHGILNSEVTIEGYNFDMVFAYTAPVIGLVTYKKMISRRVLIAWNYAGLLVIASIIFLFLASIFKPQLFGSETMLLPVESVEYPYVLVAGFLMPSAVFIHILSLVQLSKKRCSTRRS